MNADNGTNGYAVTETEEQRQAVRRLFSSAFICVHQRLPAVAVPFCASLRCLRPCGCRSLRAGPHGAGKPARI
jgi:hypothetical protein